MLRTSGFSAAMLSVIAMATPAAAGMNQDLQSCTAATGRSSAAACTRVMNSGRLPDEQFYIGYFNRGSSYDRAGDLDKALADFNKVIEIKPRFARGYLMRGMVHDGLGATGKAIADIDRAIELDAKSWAGYFSRAIVLRGMRDYDGALADLDKAAELDPQKSQVRLLHALIVADTGDSTAARSEINKVIAEGDSNAGAYYARAAVAYQEDRPDAAETDLERALDLRPDFTAAHTLMGRIEEERGNITAAKAHYAKASDSASMFIDWRSAQKTARDRLAALNGGEAPKKKQQAKADGSKPAKSAANKTDTKKADSKKAADAKSPSKDGGSSDVALSEPKREPECKRFLPATGMTISAECD